jgi:hypothetical protein
VKLAVVFVIFATVVALAGVEACILTTSKAAPTATAPTPVDDPFTGKSSPEECALLAAILCKDEERCGGTTFDSCFEQLAHFCPAVDGITEDEARTCGLAMLKTPCDGPFPAVCQDIGEQASPQPKVKTASGSVPDGFEL